MPETKREMKSNQYNNLRVDVKKLHESSFLKGHIITFKSFYLTGTLLKAGLWPKLVDSGFIRDWFDEFHIYWTEILGGRPLKFHDFFYLYSEYRKRFQEVELDENQGNFLETWQLPENIYSLFNAVYKYAYIPISFYPFRKYVQKANKILEYGCGIAPLTYSAIKYGGFSVKRFAIADIPTFTYHFAKWRLYNVENIKAINLKPYEPPYLDEKYDLIFLITVLEHLPDPLVVLNNLYDSLRSGGVVVFDFILGEGRGLDTKQAILQREKIIKYFEDNFVVEKGKLEVKKSMGITIVRKK